MSDIYTVYTDLKNKKKQTIILLDKQYREFWNTFINLESTKKYVKDLLFSEWKQILKNEDINEEINEKVSFLENSKEKNELYINELMSFIHETFRININSEEMCENSLDNCTSLILEEMYLNYNPTDLKCIEIEQKGAYIV